MHSRPKILIICLLGLLLLYPAGGWFYRRYGPLAANTPDDLREHVFAREKSTLDREIGNRVSATTTLTKSRARWNVLRQSMLQQGASPAEAKAVLATAKSFLPTSRFGWPRPHWPVLVRRGYAGGKRLWVAISLAPADDPKLANSRTGWNYWSVAVDPKNPSRFAATSVQPRLRDSLVSP